MRKSVRTGYFGPFLKSHSGRSLVLGVLWALLFLGGTMNRSAAAVSFFTPTPIGTAEAALPPGVPDMTHPDTKLTIEIDYSVADDIAVNLIKAHLVDEFGNPVVGVNVTFRWNPGSGDVNVGVTTNGDGDALLQLSSSLVGLIQVSARVGGQAFQNVVNTTFVAYVPDVSVPTTLLEVVTTGATADGAATNSVRAVVTDEDGNPVPNQPVTFSIASGSGSFTTPVTVQTDANGVAVATLTSTVAGDVSIEAVIGVTPITNGSPAVVQFVADVPDASAPTTRLEVIATNAVADGTAINSVRAVITDANGNPVANETVIFVIASGTADAVGALTVTTDANGLAVLELTSTVANIVEITASFGGGTSITNGSPASVEFVPDTPDITVPTTRLEIVTTGVVADGVSTNSVKAVITDANGNPAANQSVTFQIASGDGTFTTPVTVITDASGEASVSLSSNTVGTVGIIAEVEGVPIVNGSPAIVEFTADPPDTSVPTTFLEVVSTGAVADGVATNSVRANITDAFGNPAANVTVTFQIISGTADPVGSLTVTTDANGQAVLELTSTVVNTVDITAQVNGSVITNGSPATVAFVVDVPSVSAPTTRLEVVVNGADADGVATNSVKAVITDANGNPVANQTVTFQIASGDGTFTTPATVTTDINGEAMVSLSSTTEGSVDIIADVEGTAIINGNPATLYFILDHPDVTVATTLLEVLTTGAVADGVSTNSVRAHITDINGDPVPGQTVTFQISSGIAAPAGLLTAVTDANGDAVFFFTSTTVNTVEITATVGGSPIVNGSPAVTLFVEDAPSVTVSTTLLEVVTTGAVADDIDLNTVRAVITDEFGNPVPGQTVVFTISSGTAGFDGPGQGVTDANGVVIVNLKSTVAGVVELTATVNGIDIINGSPAAVAFVAGAPDLHHPNTTVIIEADSAKADGVSSNVLRAHVVDAYGNPVAGQTVTFAIAGGVATPGGALTVTTDANGDAVLTLTSTEVGQVDITADVNGSPISGGTVSVVFTVYADPSQAATALVVINNNAPADGVSTNSVRAHVVDNNGNPMAGQQVVFTIASGTANILTPQPVVTDANGNAVILLSSTTGGTVTVTAVVNGNPIVNGSPAELHFTAEGIWVPAVFTPNGDGVNDIIRPIINGNFNFQYFSVYNRWGNLVFTTTDVNQGWDGRLKGVMQPNETYLWILQGTSGANNTRVQKRGMFSLVR